MHAKKNIQDLLPHYPYSFNIVDSGLARTEL